MHLHHAYRLQNVETGLAALQQCGAFFHVLLYNKGIVQKWSILSVQIFCFPVLTYAHYLTHPRHTLFLALLSCCHCPKIMAILRNLDRHHTKSQVSVPQA